MAETRRLNEAEKVNFTDAQIEALEDTGVLVCMFGDSEYRGSQNEYLAVRLKKGERVFFQCSTGESGVGVVRLVSNITGELSVDIDIDGERAVLWPVRDYLEKAEASDG